MRDFLVDGWFLVFLELLLIFQPQISQIFADWTWVKIFNVWFGWFSMIDYNVRYQGIIDGLVERDFSELKGRTIWVSEMGEFRSKFCSAVSDYFIWVCFVKVSRNVRKFSKKEIEGVLAHELGHVVRFEQCDFFGKLWKGFRYFLFRKFRKLEEKACDRVAIERGYGRGLCLFRKKKKGNGFYLTAEDIEKHAKEVGKW